MRPKTQPKKPFTRRLIPPVKVEPDRKNDYRRKPKHKLPLLDKSVVTII